MPEVNEPFFKFKIRPDLLNKMAFSEVRQVKAHLRKLEQQISDKIRSDMVFKGCLFFDEEAFNDG